MFKSAAPNVRVVIVVDTDAVGDATVVVEDAVVDSLTRLVDVVVNVDNCVSAVNVVSRLNVVVNVRGSLLSMRHPAVPVRDRANELLDWPPDIIALMHVGG